MTLAYCECGHAQIVHLGPTGPCHDRVPATGRGSDGYERCPCEAFVLNDRFARRPDLA